MWNSRLVDGVRSKMTQKFWVVVMLMGVAYVGASGQSALAMQKVNDAQLATQSGAGQYYTGSCKAYTGICPSAVLTCTQENGIPHGQETIQGFRQDQSTTLSPSICDPNGTHVSEGIATCEQDASQIYLYNIQYFTDEEGNTCVLPFGTTVGLCQRYQCADGHFPVP